MSFFNAWHFLEPRTVVTPERPERLAWGLRPSTERGVALISEDASIRQSILLLIMTRPGERVMRPDYGCDIHRLVFAPNNEATANIAMHYVQTAIKRWEPRVEITRLDAYRHARHGQVLMIELDYRVRATGSLEQLELSIDLMGESR